VLGGVEFAHETGLAGHSDADVVAHAVADAVLGAAGLGDIGQLFPDDDPAYEGADSVRLLGKVADLARKAGYRVGNVDVVVVCEAPRLAPHRGRMAANLAAALGVAPAEIGLKATTTEGMGFEGRGEGIAAMAVVLLDRA
jgi:2-C-methyl-D-erythritol 2,4-cyclodiphosphate synthase